MSYQTTYTNYSLFQGELLLEEFEADGELTNLVLDGRCYTESNDNVFQLTQGQDINLVPGQPTWFDLLVPSSKTDTLKPGFIYFLLIRAKDALGNERVLFRAKINVIDSPFYAN